MVWLDLQTLTLALAAILGAGGALGLFLGRLNRTLATRLALLCAMGGSLLAAYGAVGLWRQPPQDSVTLIPLVAALPGGFPPLCLDLFADRLAIFFLLLTGLLSTGVALYSFVWLADKAEKHRIAGVYNLFVLATLLLLLVDNVYLFLVCLECMTLAFSYLTLYRHNTLLETSQPPAPGELADAKLAFKAYLVFSHVGVVFVTAALLLLALAAQDVSFGALRTLAPVEPALASAVFVLALVGLGIKGGFAPAHPWVSIVHPKSPTTTHALTLGLVIKVSSFYLLIRVLFEFLPPGPSWWGGLTLLVAGLTALAGVFFAITGRDLKTALSNHSVENFGIILAGIGLALLLSANGPAMPLAGVALLAALYHLLNHTVFKGLLYLCTGAIENRTGTVDLEALGGLLRRFPWTSISFLVGAVAIAGFPPLNGFVSEWLTLQALYASPFSTVEPQPWLVMGPLAALFMLGLALGLTALAFTKIAGETLLGQPRQPALADGEKKDDVPWRMRGVLVILAAACLLLGILPGLVAGQLAQIVQQILHLEQPLPIEGSATELVLSIPSGQGIYTARLAMVPLLVLLVLPFVLVLLLRLRVRLRTRTRPRSRPSVWTCGTDYHAQTMQITSGAFSSMIWEWTQANRSEPAPRAIPWRLKLSADRFVREPFRHALDAALGKLGAASSWFGDWFQGGDIRQYLAYLFVAVILALVVSVLW
jgi:hydrogenase-4 component B